MTVVHLPREHESRDYEFENVLHSFKELSLLSASRGLPNADLPYKKRRPRSNLKNISDYF